MGDNSYINDKASESMTSTPASGGFEAMLRLLNEGRFDELETVARQQTAANPDDAGAWQMLGVALLSRGASQGALAPLVRAAELMPGEASVWDNLGLACSNLERYADAEASFARALQIDASSVSALVNRSRNALMSGDASLAERSARRALSVTADIPAAHLNLGNALVNLGRRQDAELHFRQALTLAPGWGDAELSLGVLLETSGRLGEAERCFSGLAERFPADWRIHTNLGRVLSSLGNTKAAAASYARAVEANPGATEAFSGMLFLRLHEEGVDAGELFAQHCRFGELVEAPFREHWEGHTNTRDPERRLRVGFVSGDLRRHALAYFVEPLFEGFSATPLDIFVYSNHPNEDDVTERLKAHAATWRKVIAMSDEALAVCIRDDGIDILIDLSGHTAFNRLPMFARKPAPLQLSWLGYPATTGMRSMDYRPVYGPAVPVGLLDDQFTEKLIYLPVAMAFRNTGEVPDINPLPALKNGFVTFANLNRPSKISKGPIALWSAVLREVPGSRMLLGGIDDDRTASQIREAFGLYGIESARLDMRPYMPMKDYLALHHEIDIMLDSFPYAGGTTTNHAVRMGVPVVTLAGRGLQQRASGSIMNAAGASDWVVETEEAYLARAVRAARDLDTLAELRSGLRDRLENNPARQPEAVARGFEVALRHIWRRWCNGLPPESFVAEGGA